MDPLWAELINSDWRDHRGTGRSEDRLENETWLRAFLDRIGWRSAQLPTKDQREALRRLRRLLRRLVDQVPASGIVPPADLRRLNATLATAPLVRRLVQGKDGRSLVLVPLGGGMEQIEGAIVESFVAMLTEGDPTRIRICANPDCGWVMYDESRNRSRRWCDKTECGNLLTVRRYRQRRRAPTPRRPGQRRRRS